MKYLNKMVLGLSIIFFSYISIMGQETKDLLLADNEIAGWVFDADSIPCNTGLSNNDTSLFEVIDGGAEVYLDRGFTTGAYSGYTDGTADNYICVEIYNQGSAANAYLVYHYYDTIVTNDSTGYTPWVNIPDLGDSAHIDTTYLFEYVTELIQKNFFIRLSCPKDDQIKQSMITIGQRIVEKSVPIKYYPDKSKPANNRLAKISVYPSNGNFLFKISLHTQYFEKVRIPDLSIYNSKGLLIKKLALSSFGSQNYLAQWDGKNQRGAAIAKGVYTAVITDNNLFVRKSFIIGY